MRSPIGLWKICHRAFEKLNVSYPKPVDSLASHLKHRIRKIDAVDFFEMRRKIARNLARTTAYIKQDPAARNYCEYFLCVLLQPIFAANAM